MKKFPRHNAHRKTAAMLTAVAINISPLHAVVTIWGNDYWLGNGGTATVNPANNQWVTFTASSAAEITGAQMYANSVTGNPNLEVGLYAVDIDGKPTGSALGSGTVTASNTGWTSVSFGTNYTLTPGTTYALRVSTTNASASFGWRYNQENPANNMQPIGTPDSHWRRGNNNNNPAASGQNVWILETSTGQSIGQPYISSTAQNVASATTTIGQRFVFDQAAMGGNDLLKNVTLQLNIGATRPSELVTLHVISSSGDILGTATRDLSGAAQGAGAYTFDLGTEISLTDNTAYYLGLYSSGSVANSVQWYGWNVVSNNTYLSASFQGTNAYAVSWSSQTNFTSPSSTLTRDYYFALGLLPDAKFWAEDASGGGTGTWSATGTNWAATAGIQGQNTQSSTSTLIFGDTAGTVTVDGTVTATKGLQFSTDGYVLEGGTAISLSGLSSSSNTITTDTGVGATINSKLTGTHGLTKNGGGTLTLGGTNDYTGGTLISAGELAGTTSSLQGDITNNAVLTFNQSSSGAYSNVISGSGVLNKSGTGTVTFSGSSANTQSGDVTVSNGTLELAKTAGTTAIAGNLHITNSGTILLISTSNQVADSSNVTLSGGTIQRASGVSETFGDLTLTAASTLDYGSGAHGILTFGDYASSSLLTVKNFFYGNKLVFSSDLGSMVTNSDYFSFDHEFTYDWSDSTFTITAIPEPSAYVAAVGLIGLMLWRRMKRS